MVCSQSAAGNAHAATVAVLVGNAGLGVLVGVLVGTGADVAVAVSVAGTKGGVLVDGTGVSVWVGGISVKVGSMDVAADRLT